MHLQVSQASRLAWETCQTWPSANGYRRGLSPVQTRLLARVKAKLVQLCRATQFNHCQHNAYATTAISNQLLYN